MQEQGASARHWMIGFGLISVPVKLLNFKKGFIKKSPEEEPFPYPGSLKKGKKVLFSDDQKE